MNNDTLELLGGLFGLVLIVLGFIIFGGKRNN